MLSYVEFELGVLNWKPDTIQVNVFILFHSLKFPFQPFRIYVHNFQRFFLKEINWFKWLKQTKYIYFNLIVHTCIIHVPPSLFCYVSATAFPKKGLISWLIKANSDEINQRVVECKIGYSLVDGNSTFTNMILMLQKESYLDFSLWKCKLWKYKNNRKNYSIIFIVKGALKSVFKLYNILHVCFGILLNSFFSNAEPSF